MLMVITACNHAKPEAVPGAAFVLTDTMLAKTVFARATSDTVKSELKLYVKSAADNNRL